VACGGGCTHGGYPTPRDANESGIGTRRRVRLDDLDAKGQSPQDFIDELDGRALVASIVDLQEANPRAIVDRSELIQTLAGARDAFQEFHVDL